jgi:hypothetical protein
MDQATESEAAAKVAQALAVAVQIAEAVVRLRSQKAAGREAGARQLESAARAERTAHYAADRVTWSRTSEPRWLQDASIPDLGRAWGAATGWADTDPAAARAAGRVENRLRTIDPDTMAAYDGARATGADRMTAMRDVFAQRTADAAAPRRVFVGQPAASPGSPTPSDEAAESVVAGERTAADIAADSYPEAYTAVAVAQRTADAEMLFQQKIAAKTRRLSR